jgi:hypothetical protein
VLSIRNQKTGEAILKILSSLCIANTDKNTITRLPSGKYKDNKSIPFLIAPSVFYNVMYPVYPMLLVSPDCPFLIAPSVFSNVYLFVYVMYPVYPIVASVSGLSIIDCVILMLLGVYNLISQMQGYQSEIKKRVKQS